jgi:hypothetical protein
MPKPQGVLVSPVGYDADGYPRCWGLPFTYTAVYVESISTTAPGGGLQRLYMSAVPAGYIYIVTCVTAANVTTSTSWVAVGTYDGATHRAFARRRFYTPSQALDWSGFLVVPAGWCVYAAFNSCNAGDGLWFDVAGYKMQL